MKSYLQIILLLLIACGAEAQQNHFVYIQTDNKQPFYVKMNDNLISSSGSGYIVIPKLTAGTYPLVIGFPKEQWASQNFLLLVAQNDVGYLLKNFGEKGWGLYNMQTMEIFMSGTKGTSAKAKSEGDDAFANALAGAANTSLGADKIPPVTDIQKVEPNASVSIKRIESSNASEGRSMTYEDNTGAKPDTIRIFIPAETAPSVMNSEAVKESPVKEKNFPDTDGKTSPVNVGSSKNEEVIVKPALSFNSDCRSNATDDDFLKMRKKMASEKTDDEMVNTARKYFKTKCYSSEQIKNLSFLFLNDAGKYKFFDLAYAHVYDTQNFGSLQSQLTEEYFLTRFRAMIRN